jgi:hypothetical protein
MHDMVHGMVQVDGTWLMYMVWYRLWYMVDVHGMVMVLVSM